MGHDAAQPKLALATLHRRHPDNLGAGDGPPMVHRVAHMSDTFVCGRLALSTRLEANRARASLVFDDRDRRSVFTVDNIVAIGE